jgi:threonine dehydratase
MSTTAPALSAADLPAITLDDVRAAATRIDGAIVRTPTLHSQTLSEMVGAEVWLKFENLQFTAAYKERGALNALLLMDPVARARGVIAASAGNHAQGLAYHGKRLGVPVTIVMPKTTPQVKVYQTASHGAEIVLFGEKYDDAYAHARELEVERGLTFVHPFDHPHIAAGQGTVALEMLEDVPEIDTLIIPIGGGGLFTGMGTAARGLKNDIRLVGVQAELYPSMYARLNGVDMACEGDTLAEGIAVKEPGDYTRLRVAELNDDIVLVAGCGRRWPRRAARASGGICRTQGRAGAVRRQYRHAPARERVAARSRALGPHRAAAHSFAGPSRRLVQGDEAVRRETGQHHRNLSPAHLYHAARQGTNHRHRMRSARPRSSR